MVSILSSIYSEALFWVNENETYCGFIFNVIHFFSNDHDLDVSYHRISNVAQWDILKIVS